MTLRHFLYEEVDAGNGADDNDCMLCCLCYRKGNAALHEAVSLGHSGLEVIDVLIG